MTHQIRSPYKNFELIEMSPADTLGWMQDFHCPPYITLAHSFHAPERWTIENRTLNQYVLQYVVNGRAEYPVAGREYLTETGDLLFHRPGEVHSIRTVEGYPYVCLSVVFHFGPVTFPLEQLFGERHLLGNFAGEPLERMLTALVRDYGHPGLAYRMACQGLLMQVLSEACIGPHALEERRAGAGSTRAKLVLVKNHLMNRYPENVTHEDLEAVSGLSRNTIIAKFKQAFGMTPMQFLTRVRVQKAKELAIQTDLSIGEIARNVGYSDVHTFGKMFKKNTGDSLSRFCSALTIDYMNTRPRTGTPEGELS